MQKASLQKKNPVFSLYGCKIKVTSSLLCFYMQNLKTKPFLLVFPSPTRSQEWVITFKKFSLFKYNIILKILLHLRASSEFQGLIIEADTCCITYGNLLIHYSSMTRNVRVAIISTWGKLMQDWYAMKCNCYSYKVTLPRDNSQRRRYKKNSQYYQQTVCFIHVASGV